MERILHERSPDAPRRLGEPKASPHDVLDRRGPDIDLCNCP